MLLTSMGCAALAANPPTTMNYQGVLRDVEDVPDAPRTGTFYMTFRFFDAPTSGNEILVDAHTGEGAVEVTNGLFDVTLGGGMVTDGAGAGSYTSLGDMFRDYTDVWMEIAVFFDTLSPRVKIQSAAYALNAGALGGKPASGFLDTSSTPQIKFGPLTVNSTTGDAIMGISAGGVVGVLGSVFGAGVMAYGGPVGGYFDNTLGSQATIPKLAEGMQVVGQSTGGTFANWAASGASILATGDTGIAAYGTLPESAGHFEYRFPVDSSSDGKVDLAMGDVGILASGSELAGRFVAPGTFFTWFFAALGSDFHGAAGLFGAPNALETTVADVSGFGLATNGSKDFIQNHPTDPTRLIAYSALEGPEAGTYTRGSGSIRGGEARIALDPTFALTTNPDIGLTAVVTPRRARADLYVASVSTKELVVRSGTASAEAVAFDYVVNGLRVGFENQPVILESGRFRSATVPSIEVAARRLAPMPEDVRASTPLARLSAERARSGAGAPDLAGARALITGINSPEHALHARVLDAGGYPSAAPGDETPSPAAPAAASPGAGIPFGLSMPVAMEVQAGDVVWYDPMAPGSLRLAEEAGDPAVVGVVVGPPGLRFRDRAPIALAGTVVPCNVDASQRSIAVSDLLVASPTPGRAMSIEADPGQRTVIGKALEPLASGTGSIRILVMSR